MQKLTDVRYARTDIHKHTNDLYVKTGEKEKKKNLCEEHCSVSLLRAT